ncbi:MAG: prolipoprotein diacylglyceryl transferase family protein [Planctomycetota bacterium]
MSEAALYRLAMVGGVLCGAAVWAWLRSRRDPAMPAIGGRRMAWLGLCAVGGAALGAKLAFLVAEGWRYSDDTLALLSGQSITGALLGGYAGVEIGKRAIGHRGPTGDWFAIGVPLGIALGRLGCHARGCCAGVALDRQHALACVDAGGVHRWPAQTVELVFNLGCALLAAVATQRGWFPGNRLHLYFIAYGLFRATHELARTTAPLLETPLGPVTGYTFIALGLALFGAVRFAQRRRELATP